MKCPVCQSDLVVSDVEGIKILTCHECGGILLHYGELKKIVHPTVGDVDYSSIEDMDEDRHSKLACPSCGTDGMLDINFISYSDITMEYCKECKAMWLGKNTLEQINNEIDKINHDKENWEHALSIFLSKLPF